MDNYTYYEKSYLQQCIEVGHIIIDERNIMLRDDAIRAGLMKPTKEDRKRMGLDPIKPGPKPKEKVEVKETDVERMTKSK